MRLLCDARALQENVDGIGRYSIGMLGGLTRVRPDWEVRVLCGSEGGDHLAGMPVERMTSDARRFRRSENGKVRGLIEESGCSAYLNFSMAGPRPDIPTMITVHDLMVLNHPSYFGRSFLRNLMARRAFRGLLSRSISHASSISVPSRASLSELQSTFPIGKDRVFVSGEGQDLFPPGYLPAQPSIREDFLLYVGNARAYKNLSRLIVAYGRLRAIDPAFPPMTMVVRKDRAFEDFRRELDDCTAADSVTVMSHIDDAELRRLYSSTMGLVMPSLQEGFGLPALEAMAAGTPVVFSAGTALEELAGDAGIAVDPTSVVDIMRGMAILVSDAELRSELSAKAVIRAGGYTWDRSAGLVAERLEAMTS